MTTGFKGYEKEVIAMLRDLLGKRLDYAAVHWNGEEFHGSEQNARLVTGKSAPFSWRASTTPPLKQGLLDAEHYYKAMYYGRDESWNLRDTHMFQTLVRILNHRGDGAKAIVWAHNSHIGDAGAMSMGWSREEIKSDSCARRRTLIKP